MAEVEAAGTKRSRPSGSGGLSRRLLSRVAVGKKIAVYWPDDDKHYPGTVSAHLPNEWQRHVYRIDYDDGEVETIDLSMETFRLIDTDGDGDHSGVAEVDCAAEVKSLTVRLDQRTSFETWRSPPTFYGGQGFAWPRGWVEVQRLSPYQKGDRHEWIREFHPPYRRGHKGRTRICHSIEEVQKYVEHQRSKQMKQERRAPSRDGKSRRYSGRRRSSSPHPSLPREGTQAELNKIVKRGDKLSERMRKSILYGAVLARKKGIVETGPGFLGADGGMYPDLRKAFGKHVDVKQCSLCKSRVQGNWYCRILHSHLDKPDYDGGDSAACLVELFRCSIEELEVRLWSLLPGAKAESLKKKGIKGFDSAEWSMNRLSDDILYQIASFLPTLPQLVSFCKTSKRGQQLLYGSVHSEKLFRGVFLRTFGEQGTKGNFERNLTWRERWFMIRDLRRGLARKAIRPPGAVARRLRETLGVLPLQEEREVIFYDNPRYGDPERAYCNGYFGMEILHLPPPPNAGVDWQPPVVVTGDFNGIRIFDSLCEAIYYGESSDGDGIGGEVGTGGREGEQIRFLSLGHQEGGGQILSLVHCEPNSASLPTDPGESCPPSCFIGHASGRVSALCAKLAAEGDKYTYDITRSHHAHDNEVTALAFVNCSSTPGREDVPVLFSACCAGKVYFYPDALDRSRTFSLGRSVPAFANFYDCPIYSMASTVVRSRGRSFSVLCTGDRDGNIRIWLKPDDDLAGLCAGRAGSQRFRHIQLYKSSTHRGTGYHLVTRAMFVRDGLLITGTNNGDVRFWQLQCSEDPSRTIGKGPLPGLTLRYDLMGIHNGAVELLTNVGDVLLTSGGSDGRIVGWDISTGLRLGNIHCHPGRQMEEGGAAVCSCVVDLLMSGKDGSLISLCRDGSLRQLML